MVWDHRRTKETKRKNAYFQNKVLEQNYNFPPTYLVLLYITVV